MLRKRTVGDESKLAYAVHTVYYRVAPKSKPLPNDEKIVLAMTMRLDLFVKLKYESSTIILFVSIRQSMRDLLSGLNNYA